MIQVWEDKPKAVVVEKYKLLDRTTEIVGFKKRLGAVRASFLKRKTTYLCVESTPVVTRQPFFHSPRNLSYDPYKRNLFCNCPASKLGLSISMSLEVIA